jgi:epsilon-lactone hydrolase
MARFTNDELLERLRAVPKAGADIDFDKARAALERQTAKAPLHEGTTASPVDAGGVPAEWVDPATPPTNGRAILYLHGGGYVMGSIGSHRALASHLAAAADARVLLIDYRLAPEDPHPAAVDDAVAAWRWMVGPGGADRTRSVIAGDSAGGGLTAATTLALKQAGDPAPAGVVCLSPFVDMEATGESHTSKADADPVVGGEGLKAMATAYLGRADARDPLVSPIHGDWTGAPPMLIQVGTNEVLLDDSRTLTKVCREAGVQVTLEEWDGMVHVFQSFCGLIDDADRAVERIGAWVKEMTP